MTSHDQCQCIQTRHDRWVKPSRAFCFADRRQYPYLALSNVMYIITDYHSHSWGGGGIKHTVVGSMGRQGGIFSLLLLRYVPSSYSILLPMYFNRRETHLRSRLPQLHNFSISIPHSPGFGNRSVKVEQVHRGIQ